MMLIFTKGFHFFKRHDRLCFLVFCFVVVFLIYGRALAGDFVFDDRFIVDYQYLLSDLNSLHKILALPYWTEAAGLYRPIVLVSYAFNYVFFGAKPWGFHLVNLVFYALSGYLIFLLARKLARPVRGEASNGARGKFLAALAATLFLVLPIHAEAAANITGRSEILALFFSLLVFWELSRVEKSFWRPGLWFLLALGSKETAIAALPIAFIFLLLKEKPPFNFRKFWCKYFYLFLSLAGGAAVYFLARFLVLGRQHFLGVATSIVENPLKFAGVAPRIYTALQVLVIYLQKTFWPFGLCSDYSYNQILAAQGFFNAGTMLGAAALVLFCAAIFIFWRRRPLLSLGAAIFLFSFLPVANLIFPIGTIAGERLMYFPSLGVIFLVVGGLASRCRHCSAFWQRVPMGHKCNIGRGCDSMSGNVGSGTRNDKYLYFLFRLFFIAIIIFYSVMSFRRAGDWLNEKRLFVSAAKCAPNSVLSRSNLGAVYYLEGDYASAKKELLEAQAIYDSYPKGVNNLGLVYWKTGERQKAREYFLRAPAFEFPYYGAYENLALMALEEKKFDEARDWLLKFYSGNRDAAERYIRAYQEGAGK